MSQDNRHAPAGAATSHADDAATVRGPLVSDNTRDGIQRFLLAHPRCTANEIAKNLELTPAGVRRHLSALVDEGLVETISSRTIQGRGRPAQLFRLTAQGREQFGHAYDLLATELLDALCAVGGREAVWEFARKRAEKIVATFRYHQNNEHGLEDAKALCADIAELDGVADVDADELGCKAHAIADAFIDNGYSVTVQQGGSGIQICHHHCPIASVAEKYPEFCEAEHDAITEAIGSHAQTLATIADGHGVCTTNIPLRPLRLVSPAANDPPPREE